MCVCVCVLGVGVGVYIPCHVKGLDRAGVLHRIDGIKYYLVARSSGCRHCDVVGG